MTIANFYIEPAPYARDFADIHQVRQAVFVEEQLIPAEIEFDELDTECYHVLVRDLQLQPIGTGRLLSNGKIGRMAVLPQWRNQSVGASILRALIEKARQLGLVELTAHAQVSALGFYQKQGFVAEGEVFMEVAIPHQAVRLVLTAIDKTVPRVITLRNTLIESSKFNTQQANYDAALQLVSAARRELRIYSYDLEQAVYGQTEMLAALKQLALKQNSQIHILIQQPGLARNPPHLLIDLAQRLSSHFLIRTPVEPEDLQYPSAYLINDCDGYLFRQQQDRYLGHWSPIHPSRNRQLQEEFERVWQRSVPCSEFRVLGL